MKINVRNRNKGTDKPASWEYRFEVARVGGKRKQFSRSGFRTKKEAEAAGLKALMEYQNHGSVIISSDMSYSDFLDLWLVNYSPNLKESSIIAYKQIIEKYIRPELGKYSLKSLNTMSLQAFVNEMFNRDLSFSVKNKTKALIYQTLKYAVVPCGFLQSNPAQYLTTPKYSQGGRKVERYVYTTEQIHKLVDYYGKYHPFSAAILISLYSGLRAGEVFALTWDDIDFEAKTITVSKSVSPKLKVSTPKTEHSNRIVLVGDALLKYLLKYRTEQKRNELYYGEYYRHVALQDCFISASEERDDNFIIRRENGEYATYNAFKTGVEKTVSKKLGFNINFHSFRHTHATLLIESGISPKVVQERLGHADISTTMNKYVHVTDKMQSTAVEVFEKTVGEALTS